MTLAGGLAALAGALAALAATALVALFGLAAWGRQRWAAGTRALRARLEAGRQPCAPGVVDFDGLEALPPPVQRYLRAVLEPGRPRVSTVRLAHAGQFAMGEACPRWVPFTSEQRVTLQRPGFDWDARVRLLPGVAVYVHDAYVAGGGVLHAALLGLFTVARLRGTRELAEGELMRFLGEAAWYPMALLPGQGVQWTAADARSARATLRDGEVQVTLCFGFGDDGLLETVRADARGRTVGGQVLPTPWQVRVWNYALRDGVRVPLDGEAAWLLPEGPRPYWRGRITAIGYA